MQIWAKACAARWIMDCNLQSTIYMTSITEVLNLMRQSDKNGDPPLVQVCIRPEKKVPGWLLRLLASL
jgi:hypothetical protein